MEDIMRKFTIGLLLFSFVILLSFLNCAKTPQTAEELLDWSVTAHGGSALTEWNTLTIMGDYHQDDGGHIFEGAYRVWAERSEKLRIERDLTPDGGRLFYTFFYNNGVGWMQMNLIPRSRPEHAEAFKKQLDLLDGVSYYAKNATDLTLLGEEDVNGKSAYKLQAIVEPDTVDLFFDKSNFYLVREKTGNVMRTYSQFTKFGDVTYGAVIDEKTETPRGAFEVKFIYKDVTFNADIDQNLFTEDMPPPPPPK